MTIIYPGDAIDEQDLIPFPVMVPRPITPPIAKHVPFSLHTTSDDLKPSIPDSKNASSYAFARRSSSFMSAVVRTVVAGACFLLATSLPKPHHRCSFSSSESSSPTFTAPAMDTERYSSRSQSVAELVAAYQRPQNAENDAGNKPLDHYKSRLPAWRYKIRNAMLPLIRWETPYLAAIQEKVRCTPLDVFFVLSANLGTHTFYVVMIPLLFWFGLTLPGRDFVFVLSLGVYITGFIKDLLCLPRPLSPPLHRLTMSGSAALEYGFPSTHTANAVSASLIWFKYFLDQKETLASSGHLYIYYTLQSLNVLYVTSMCLGRIYCGMHGFCDVIAGALIGVGLWWIRVCYGPAMDYILLQSPNAGYWEALCVLSALILVRIHPEPIDDCPCFDDGVAFIAVLAGSYVGQWHFGVKSLPSSVDSSCPACIPYDTNASFFLVKSLLRLAIGLGLITIWRPTMKRALHEGLPPIFRFVEKIGLSMPRKYFLRASEYEDVPSQILDANLFSSDNITGFIRRIKHRSDSVGPQSAADVYETLAYREHQKQLKAQKASKLNGESGLNYRGSKQGMKDNVNETGGISSSAAHSYKPVDKSSFIDKSMPADDDDDESSTEVDISQVVTPRVKYDVEVITRLIVYAGIAVIACDVCGVIFTTMGI